MGLTQSAPTRTLSPEHLNGMTALGVQKRGDQLMILAEDPSGRTFGTVYVSLQAKSDAASLHAVLRAFHPGGGVTTWPEKRIADVLAPLVPFQIHYAGDVRGERVQMAVLPLLIGVDTYERVEGPCHCDSRKEAEEQLLADINASGGYRGTPAEFPGFVFTMREEVTLRMHPVKLTSPLTPLPKQLSSIELVLPVQPEGRRLRKAGAGKDTLTPVPSSSSLTQLCHASEERASSSSASQSKHAGDPGHATTPAAASNASFPRPPSDDRVDRLTDGPAPPRLLGHARVPSFPQAQYRACPALDQLPVPHSFHRAAGAATPSPSYPFRHSASGAADDRASSCDPEPRRHAAIAVPCSVNNAGVTYYGVRSGADPMVWRSEKSLRRLKDLAVQELQRTPLGSSGDGESARGWLSARPMLPSKHSASGDSAVESVGTSSPLASPRSEAGDPSVVDSFTSSLCGGSPTASTPWEDSKVLHAVLMADAHPSADVELPLFGGLCFHTPGHHLEPSASSASFSSSVIASPTPGDARPPPYAHAFAPPTTPTPPKSLQGWGAAAVAAAKEKVVELWLNRLGRLDHPGVALFLRLFLGGASCELARSAEDGTTAASELLFLSKRKIPRHVLNRVARGGQHTERERASSTCSRGSRSATSEAGLSSARSAATSGRRGVPYTPLTALTAPPALTTDDVGLAMVGRQIVDVVRNSAAHVAGLRAGMVVQTVGGSVAWTGADVETAFADFGAQSSKRQLPLVVARLKDWDASRQKLGDALPSARAPPFHLALPTTPSTSATPAHAAPSGTHCTPHGVPPVIVGGHHPPRGPPPPPYRPHLAGSESGSEDGYEQVGIGYSCSFVDALEDEAANVSDDPGEASPRPGTPDNSDVPVEGSIALLKMLNGPLAHLNGSAVRLLSRAPASPHWVARLLHGGGRCRRPRRHPLRPRSRRPPAPPRPLPGRGTRPRRTPARAPRRRRSRTSTTASLWWGTSTCS
eukprot:TRINITY_DN12714_c0_g1_i5.p1 TRINITY_DN12714_c0_g1~~TRINITY_DN12714_c0_g1_i5.p1  ORF type:complete len:983 (+),score=251.91 TRINITY_DN12714_c0_g1_i5:195-3143(+)